MKTLLSLVFSALFLLIGSYTAHSQAFNEDDVFISAGFGYTAFNFSNYFLLYEDENEFRTGSFGPVNLQVEKGLSEDISLGVDIGYSNSSASWSGQGQRLNESTNEFEDVDLNYDYTRTKLTINLRGNYHLAKDEVLDPYLGFGMGFKASNWNFQSNDDLFDSDVINFGGLIPVSLTLRFGCRFMFSDNLGAYVEGGAGHGLFQGGLSLKL